jgi:hypothetical protein
MTMKRRTAKDCRALLTTMGKNAGFPVKNTWDPKGGYFYIEVAYGRPKIEYHLKDGGAAEVSPRLPAGRLLEWIHTFGATNFKAFHAYRNKVIRERKARRGK